MLNTLLQRITVNYIQQSYLAGSTALITQGIIDHHWLFIAEEEDADEADSKCVKQPRARHNTVI